MLDDAIKAPLHIHNRSSERQRLEGDQTIQCWATPRAIRSAISPSKSHLHNPEEHRGAQWKVGTQIKDLSILSGPLPGEPSTPLSRHEAHHDESRGAALQFQTKGCVGRCWLGVGHSGLRGKAVLDHTGLLMGCLGDLEVNKCGGKIEGQEDNRGQLHINSSSDHCSISVKR